MHRLRRMNEVQNQNPNFNSVLHYVKTCIFSRPLYTHTVQFSVNKHLRQMQSHWTPLDLIYCAVQRNMPVFPIVRSTGGNLFLTRMLTLISVWRMFCAWSRTTVGGPVFIQSPGNLMQCNKSWRVLFFKMWWKLESILTGRQLKTTHTLTIKHLEDYAAVKWKCFIQNRVDIYFPKKKDLS